MSRTSRTSRTHTTMTALAGAGAAAGLLATTIAPASADKGGPADRGDKPTTSTSLPPPRSSWPGGPVPTPRTCDRPTR
ncbi:MULTISPECIES: hypothetical protein [unclassified Streptomyces]|uniref:hypothetical protein n=1 Tax=unclassified Streptomyces TaxID=2593676 RepID=UPI000AA7A9AE|nr:MULTISPECIES: hypothetical protein [unclassified Streptomyces]